LLVMAADICVPVTTLHRHMPVLRRCLGPDDRAVVIAACARSERPRGRYGLGSLLLLTRQRLVVTSESGMLRKLRLHLNADLSQLAEVAWTPEPEQGGIQLSATAVDGIREHFWIRVGGVDQLRKLDSAFRDAFV
jgi:hypothetical protein